MEKLRKITGVLVNVDTGEIKEHVLDYKDYRDFYPMLNCSTFTVASRKFNGKMLDIYCDDEGLLKEGSKPAIITSHNGKVVEVIVGNCFIASVDKNGGLKALTKKEVESVLKARGEAIIDKTHKYNVLLANL